MMITNIRLGFATNSSSSHSIIFNPEAVCREDDGNIRASCFDDDYYTLETTTGKLALLAKSIGDMLERQNVPSRLRRCVLVELFTGTNIVEHIDFIMEAYIQHNPISASHNSWRDLASRADRLIEVLSDPRITVEGGYNYSFEEDEHPNARELIIDSDQRIRKDGDAFVIYNTYTGAKIRISDKPYEKATIPELVDLKITDYCPFGCGFCYQNSSREGQEASPYALKGILRSLAQLGVFEVALGGGEPTEYQFIDSIINYAYERGITPNITTYSTEWLNSERKLSAMRKCGGIGVSVHSKRDFRKVLEIKEKLPDKRVVMQHVAGTSTYNELMHMLWFAYTKKIPALLLGYKKTGRGVEGAPHNLPKDAKSWHGSKLPELSVDTAFADQHPEFLAGLARLSGGEDVQNLLVSSREGAFSMYIDAVTQQLAPSSYCEPSAMIRYAAVPSGDLAGFIRTEFAKF